MTSSIHRKEHDRNSYYPTFLYMDLKVYDSLSYLCRYPLDKETEAAFLHEYIHFLQDITTYSGYTLINVLTDRMRWGVNRKGCKIKIPLKFENTWSDNIASNAYNQKIHSGSGKVEGIKIPSTFNHFLKKTKIYTGREKYQHLSYVLCLEFEYGSQKKEYHIGEYAISESMAYMIETQIYPDVLPPPSDFPYKVIDALIKTKYPSLYNIEIMVALCDVSLMFQFPGMVLFYLCQQLEKESQQKDVCFIDVYNLAYSDKFTKEIGVKSRFEAMVENKNLTLNQIKSYFNMVSVWDSIDTVIDITMSNALWLRQVAPYFIIDILRGGPIYNNIPLKVIVSKLLGCPCIKTNTGELYWFVPDTSMPSYLYPFQNYLKRNLLLLVPEWVNFVINQPTIRLETDLDNGVFVASHTIHNILFTRDAINTTYGEITMACPLKKWCRKSFIRQQITDLTSTGYNCSQYPWGNAKTPNVDQCVFGRLWSAWGLSYKKLRMSNQEI